MARRGGNDRAIRQTMYFFLGAAVFFGIFGVIGVINGTFDVIGAIGITCAPLIFVLILFLRLKRNARADRERSEAHNAKVFFAQREREKAAYRASVAGLPEIPLLKLWDEGENRMLDPLEELAIIQADGRYQLLRSRDAKKKKLVKFWLSPHSRLLNCQKQVYAVDITVNGLVMPEGVIQLLPGDVLRVGDLRLRVHRS